LKTKEERAGVLKQMVFGCNSEENVRISERGCDERMEYCQIIASSGSLGEWIMWQSHIRVTQRPTVLYPALTTTLDIKTKPITFPFLSSSDSSVFSITE
jgi:hypothetical protein